MRSKRTVLILLGWNDPRSLLTFARHARTAQWHLETRHFFTDVIPHGWSGDGMIVLSPSRADMRDFIQRQAGYQPTVIMGGNNPGIVAPQVMEDNLAAGRMVARHFLRRGHRHFAWLNAFEGRVPEDRWTGYRDTLAEAGRECVRLEYRAQPGADDDWRQRREWMAARLRELPRPLALLALDDQMATECVEVCLDSGLRVPQDVAVAGVGNIALACETSQVPITSVDLGEESIADTAARLLDRLMRGEKPPREPLVIPPVGLIERASTEALVLRHPVALKAAELVEQQMDQPVDVDQLAVTAGVSRRTLHNVIREELGCTPAEFVLERRMSRARRLLTDRRALVRDVVVACGFGTVRTFNRSFRKTEGVSPREWRQRATQGIFEMGDLPLLTGTGERLQADT